MMTSRRILAGCGVIRRMEAAFSLVFARRRQTKRYPMVSINKMPNAFVLVSVLSLFAFAPSAQAFDGLAVAGTSTANSSTVLVGDRNCQSQQGNCEVKCMSAGGANAAVTACFERCQAAADACADQ
jgi:hypothetical protein